MLDEVVVLPHLCFLEVEVFDELCGKGAGCQSLHTENNVYEQQRITCMNYTLLENNVFEQQGTRIGQSPRVAGIAC